MYYIGIDISKYKHDCAVIDGNGEVITPSWSFKNDSDGFIQIRQLLRELDGEKRIGFEATGHYGSNLKQFLSQNGFSFMEFNPVLLKRFVSGKTLRRTKTDPIDALNIAQYLMTVEYKPYPVTLYHTNELKSLTRFREKLVKQRSQISVELTDALDELFPEFKPFFNHQLGPTAIHILTNYGSPEKISRMNVKSYEKLRSVSHGRFSAADFAALKNIARNTVGRTNESLTFKLRISLEQFALIDSAVSETEKKIEAIVRMMNPPLLTIPGIGINTAAVILAEYGDISRFSSPSKMLAFAGLEPGYFQSGTEESFGRMVKHGSSHLRYAIMNCCLPLIRCNCIFAEYYSKKRAEGKSHTVALSHVAKKLIRIIYTLQTNNISFSYDRCR